MTTTVTVDDPRDLVAHLPYRLGFHPADSVVLAGLCRGPSGRDLVGLVVRCDLADLGHPAAGPALAATLGGHLLADGAYDVFAVVYLATSRRGVSRDERVRHARRALVDAMPWAASLRGPWFVGHEAFGHLDPCRCCAAGGRPLRDLETSVASAAFVADGRAAVRCREDLAVVRTQDTAARAAAARAGAQERRRVAAARAVGAAFRPPPAESAELCRLRQEHCDLWDSSLGEVPAHATLGRLLVALEDTRVRDAVLAATLAGGDVVARDLLPVDAVDLVLTVAPPPERDTIVAADRLACAVVAHAPDGAAAPALGLLSYLCWWDAAGARADVLAGQALQEQPGHRLAVLVREALDAAVPPPWYPQRHEH
ncbi:DUF4192 domain-containing protein [Georgenia muralis]|uniref:Uncharacterized protein DUF4192 n=1 Tax=Georgenia muralis TaxID=154117 RepID=A0A3N5AAL4_9MICO|nr:DUF4192 domain-containing protein [Georgenia muralis]RPF28661.1 uncharacterized protein DUF4192 [Georgenia muralis]